MNRSIGKAASVRTWVRNSKRALLYRDRVPERLRRNHRALPAGEERLVKVLTDAGLVDVEIDGVHELMWFGDDADAAYRFVTGQGFTEFLLRGLDPGDRERALADLRASIDAHETDDGVLYPSAAWIATARASAPQRATRGEPTGPER